LALRVRGPLVPPALRGIDRVQYSDGLRAALKIYLVVYFAIVAGAATTLWRSGLIEHLPRGWTVTVIVGAVALGVLLAALSRE
jgi:hypothetical protein